MSDLDFLAELDAELAVEMEKVTKRKRAEDAKKTSNNMRLSREQREAAKAEHLALKAQIEAERWQAEASVAMFTEQHCDGCGSVHRTFLQFMERHFVIGKPTTIRWIRVTSARKDLLRETLIQPMTTHMCAHCCEDHGFALEGPTRSNLPPRPFITASALYQQEDINGTSEEN